MPLMPHPTKPKADWFSASKWGAMFHYLNKPASSNIASDTTSEEWNRCVEEFNVSRFINQIQSTGAGYIIFTLGQNTGHFCAPNPVYDEIMGIHPSRLSRRDLIAEIAGALPSGVRLIAYLPSQPPVCYPEAVSAFECMPSWDASAWGLKKTWPDSRSVNDRLSGCQRKWEAVIRYWGETWGENVSGWWIDGCYFVDKLYHHVDEPNFTSFARALRAGNPSRILSFNGGTKLPIGSISEEDDYTAGEMDKALPIFHKWLHPDAKGLVPRYTLLRPEGTPLLVEVKNSLPYHYLSFLGDWWGEGDPRFPDDLVAIYTRYLNSHGGVVTWDVPIGMTGEIAPTFLRQLSGLPERVAHQ